MVESYMMTKSSTTEIKVKSYHCSEMLFPKCDGYLTVTNKRVIFHGLADKAFWLDVLLDAIRNFLMSVISKIIKKRIIDDKPKSSSRIAIEIDLNTISGVSSYYGTKTNLIMLAIGILALIVPLPIYSQFRNYQARWRSFGMHHNFSIEILAIILVIATIAIGLGLLAYCRRQVFHLQIFSSQATGAPIAIGEGIGNLGGARATYALVGRPTISTDRMMTELGAMISDLKEMGDHAVELWKPKSFFSSLNNKK